jgi:hypothetical protein
MGNAAAAALRAEHDALAKRLEIRVSVDRVRRAAYLGFAGLIGFGMTLKLAWDRYAWVRTPAEIEYLKAHPFKGPPIFMYLAMGATCVLLSMTIRALLEARRLMREEDALFARLLALRKQLGFDA